MYFSSFFLYLASGLPSCWFTALFISLLVGTSINSGGAFITEHYQFDKYKWLPDGRGERIHSFISGGTDPLLQFPPLALKVSFFFCLLLPLDLSGYTVLAGSLLSVSRAFSLFLFISYYILTWGILDLPAAAIENWWTRLVDSFALSTTSATL